MDNEIEKSARNETLCLNGLSCFEICEPFYRYLQKFLNLTAVSIKILVETRLGRLKIPFAVRVRDRKASKGQPR